MQASKPLTPVKSKPTCKDSQQNDSLAQRVMEVTTVREKLPPVAKSALKRPLVSTSGSDNNSIESSVNDHEVESITNQAAKIDLASISTMANINDNKEQKHKATTLSSPLSLLSTNILTDCHRQQQQQQQQQQHKQNLHMQQHQQHLPGKLNGPLVSQSCQLKSEEIESRKSAHSIVEVSAGSVASHEQIVSLDTKVPHPASNFCNEEVSYYNETPATSANKTATTTATITNLLEPKQMGGSLDNNTKPRLLAAVASGQNHMQGRHRQQQQQEQLQNYHNHILQQQQHIRQQQASLMATSSSCQHLMRHNLYSNEDEHTGNMASCDDDVRYDNAEVERNLEAQRLNELRLISADEALAADSPNGCQRHKQVSISTSPKAKSAPTTPCNVTPTAFHQVSTNASFMLAKQNGNTLPPDIRKNISATCRVVPSSLNADSSIVVQSTASRQDLEYLDNLRDEGERALLEKDYPRAIELLSQCISLAEQQQLGGYLQKNFKIYSHRAEAHLKLAKYNEAIEDSMAARDLNPKWTQAYYLQGRAQFLIKQYEDALAVFAFGITHQDGGVSSGPLFEAFVEAALSFSPNSFTPKFQKLKSLQLDTKQFVVVGLLGQELFSAGHNEHAAIVLESALKVSNLEPVNDPASISQQKKFKSSVLSTISAAYCKLGDLNKAIDYMERELRVETELEDVAGQCRVLANLGHAYFKVRKFEVSLEMHRKQLNLALKLHMFEDVWKAFKALGHVHVARNKYTDALTSHSNCLSILKRLGGNYMNQFEEMLAIGHIHSQLGDLKAAETHYNEALQLLRSQNNLDSDETTQGRILAEFNLAYLSLKKQAYQEAEKYYSSVLQLAKSLNQGSIKRCLYKMRAFNGLGQTFRLTKRFDQAKAWFEQQRQLGIKAQCKLGQSQALCNLGMIYQHFKNYEKASQLFEENLKLVDKNPELEAYAHSYLGSNYFLVGRYCDSRSHYDTSLKLFRKLSYREDERKTIEMNLALVRDRLVADGSQTMQSKKRMMAAN